MRSGAKQFEKKIAAKNSILNIILTLINHQIKSQVIFFQKSSKVFTKYFFRKTKLTAWHGRWWRGCRVFEHYPQSESWATKKVLWAHHRDSGKVVRNCYVPKRTICTNLVLFLGIWLVLGSPSKRQLERPSSSICDY